VLRIEDVPEVARLTMQNYAAHGWKPGDFIRAVLANNLTEAFGRADDINTAHMKEIVWFAYNHLPYQSRGSSEKVAAWIKHQGMDGSMSIKELKAEIAKRENYLATEDVIGPVVGGTIAEDIANVKQQLVDLRARLARRV